MMITFKAKGGSEFFYDPVFDGEIWITAPDESAVPRQFAIVAAIPAVDFLEFAAHAAEEFGEWAPLEERFLSLSLEMARHTSGQDFCQAMRSFPSAKFHEWCDLAKRLERMSKEVHKGKA